MKIKYYNLSLGAKAVHGDETLTFTGMDGMYARWTNEQGEIRIGHAEYYKKKDGIYYPVSE